MVFFFVRKRVGWLKTVHQLAYELAAQPHTRLASYGHFKKGFDIIPLLIELYI